MKSILITGGAGFIGSALARSIIQESDSRVLVYDKLTYAGNIASLANIINNERFAFEKADICDRNSIRSALGKFEPDIIIHLAAESHVDRSIDGPAEFISTNLVGTFNLLDLSFDYYKSLSKDRADIFRFIHVSTDEVFGSLGAEGLFNESSRYSPNSPYSASKAGSDHLARAWYHTYGLPVIITNCSNNYGPYHFPEKLIPLMIINALENKPLPVYGKGENIRDWLYVQDHVFALRLVAEKGVPGQYYNIGGGNEWRNIDVIHLICDTLNNFRPRPGGYRDLITFVADRPGHDLRYAIDSTKIKRDLGWLPKESFETGLHKTISWYLDNSEWWKSIRHTKYRGERLGSVNF